MHKVAPAGIYEYVIVRTRIFDQYFLQALQEGFEQIVILGAGMDTRALRFADQNNGTRIIEVDLPGVQESKLDILRRKGVTLPDELVFIPMDFNRQDLADELAATGYRQGCRTLFLWEGICMYLQAEAVDAMFAFMRETAGESSLIVFDYVRASVLRKEHNLYGEEQIYTTVSNTGEGWTFGIEEDNLADYLAQRGFCLLAHYTSQDMQRDYLTAEDGSLFGRINGTHHIASACLRDD
jgi:methyltransferase (TIGR00027 family)